MNFNREQADQLRDTLGNLRRSAIGVTKVTMDGETEILTTPNGDIVLKKSDDPILKALVQAVRQRRIQDLLNQAFNNHCEIEKFKTAQSRANHFTSAYWVDIKEFTLTSEGYYLKFKNVRTSVSLMIDWDGNLLARKSGKEIGKLY